MLIYLIFWKVFNKSCIYIGLDIEHLISFRMTPPWDVGTSAVTRRQGQVCSAVRAPINCPANIPVMSRNLFIIPGHNSVFTPRQSQHYNWVWVYYDHLWCAVWACSVKYVSDPPACLSPNGGETKCSMNILKTQIRKMCSCKLRQFVVLSSAIVENSLNLTPCEHLVSTLRIQIAWKEE